jgi:2-amino-4-hydroxy-6-hydroxymethyldihydropteridine diphosphokinase
VRTGYIGLGSNQGDRLGLLRAARDRLPGHGVRVLRASSVYETEPVAEAAGQPDFLNACLRVETELEPEELLEVCKALERELGREPGGPRHGPRPLDLDVLLLGGLEETGDRLTLPHPEILRRRFVLVPLLELDPELRLPDGRALADALDATRGQRVERVGTL